jgi:hypothetical protein
MVFIVVFNEYITICENQKKSIIQHLAYADGFPLLIMGLEWVVMRTSANYNILRNLRTCAVSSSLLLLA